MELSNFLKRVSETKDKVAEIATGSQDKLNALLEQYKQAVTLVAAFGFKVGKFRVGMGILPEITTSIFGDIARIDTTTIKELIEKNRDKALVTAILTTFLTAKNLNDQVDFGEFTKVTIEVCLAIPPKISFDLGR